MFSERCHGSFASQIVVLFGPPQKLEALLHDRDGDDLLHHSAVDDYLMLLSRWFFSEAYEVDVKIVLVLTLFVNEVISRQSLH